MRVKLEKEQQENGKGDETAEETGERGGKGKRGRKGRRKRARERDFEIERTSRLEPRQIALEGYLLEGVRSARWQSS